MLVSIEKKTLIQKGALHNQKLYILDVNLSYILVKKHLKMVRVNIEHVRKFSALMEDFKVSIKNISHHPDTEFGIANFGKQQGIPLEFSGSRNEQFTVSGPNFFFRSFSIKEPHVFGKDHLEVKFIIEGLKGARRKSDDKDFDILIELSGHIEVNTFFSKF